MYGEKDSPRMALCHKELRSRKKITYGAPDLASWLRRFPISRHFTGVGRQAPGVPKVLRDLSAARFHTAVLNDYLPSLP